MTSRELNEAGRCCETCAEPLSVYEPNNRCRRCRSSYRIVPMNPLVRRVQSQKRVAEQLEKVPKFNVPEGD